MQNKTSISEQGASFRQGVVLGLTMAEIFLLLVFCLLLAFVLYLKNQISLREKAELRVEQLVKVIENSKTENKDTDGLSIVESMRIVDRIAKYAQSTEISKIDENWRRLVDNDKIVRQLEAKGISPDVLAAQSAEGLKIAQTQNLVELQRKASELERVMAILKSRGIDINKEPPAPKVDTSGHKWPPIIRLSEADGYNFASGSAELSGDFRDYLTQKIVASLLEYARDYQTDIVEVVGHTDEQPIGTRVSNLDKLALLALSGKSDVRLLSHADNAGLGIARAISVVSVLRNDVRLKQLTVIPLSAAQLIETNGKLSAGGQTGDVKQRRRIEIRMRKSVE